MTTFNIPLYHINTKSHLFL